MLLGALAAIFEMRPGRALPGRAATARIYNAVKEESQKQTEGSEEPSAKSLSNCSMLFRKESSARRRG